MTSVKKIVFLVGPTATGKTAVSLNLSQQYPLEVISADSMQIYKELNIGTAKVSEAERQMVRHHMVDICEPSSDYNAFDYRTGALAAIDDVFDRGKLPVVVGGTGLYIKALTDGLAVQPAASAAMRNELERELEQRGLQTLFAELQTIDPVRAAAINSKDARRIMRALEIYKLSGIAPSVLEAKKESLNDLGYSFLIVGLEMDRARLYERVNQRVDAMLAAGLVDEVKSVKDRLGNTPRQAVGYKEIIQYLDGDIDYGEAVRIIKRNTRHFVKRQYTWFRKDQSVEWVLVDNKDIDVVAAEVSGKIERFLAT